MRHLLLISALLSTLSSSLVQASDALSRSVAQEVVSNSQTWRSRQNDGDYVIQLVSVRKAMHLPKAEDIRAIKSVNPDLDVVYHPKRVKGATWHTLVWGSFASKAEGNAMFSQLPARWQKMQPWVRPMSSIQGAAPVIITKAKPKAVAKPVVAKPVPRTRPTPKIVSKKHPVSPADRSQFSSQAIQHEDAYENYAPDLSNHESAIAAQGTYPYLKLSAGQIQQDSDALLSAANAAGTNVTGVDNDYTDTIYEIALGLDIGYYLGVELGYIDASALEDSLEIPGNTILNSATALAFKEQGPFGFTGVKGSLVVKLPIDARRQWQPFVQVGAMQWTSEIPALGNAPATENKSTDLFYAAGLDYKLNKKWALGVKYTAYDMDAEAQALTADLTWRWEGRQ